MAHIDIPVVVNGVFGNIVHIGFCQPHDIYLDMSKEFHDIYGCGQGVHVCMLELIW